MLPAKVTTGQGQQPPGRGETQTDGVASGSATSNSSLEIYTSIANGNLSSKVHGSTTSTGNSQALLDRQKNVAGPRSGNIGNVDGADCAAGVSTTVSTRSSDIRTGDNGDGGNSQVRSYYLPV